MLTRGLALARALRQKWAKDDVMRLAAAVTFFGLLALAPLLLLVALLAKRFADPARVQEAITRGAAELLGPEGAEVIRTVLATRDVLGSDPLVIAVGAATLLFSASNLVVQLQRALNEIWDVAARPDRGLLRLLLRRLVAAGLVLGVALLLLLMPLLDAVLDRIQGGLGLGALGQPGDWALLAGVTAVGCALLFKWLPDARVAWRDAAVGALVAALLFTTAQAVLGRLLGRLTVATAFDAAGSLVVLLLWTYVSVLILFAAAEVTQVVAVLRGEPVVPLEHAVARRREQEARRGEVELELGRVRGEGHDPGAGDEG